MLNEMPLLCKIWEDIVRVHIVLKTRSGRNDAALCYGQYAGYCTRYRTSHGGPK